MIISSLLFQRKEKRYNNQGLARIFLLPFPFFFLLQNNDYFSPIIIFFSLSKKRRKRKIEEEIKQMSDLFENKKGTCIAFSHDLFTFYALLSRARLILDALLPFTGYASAENAFRNGTIAQLTTIKRSLALIAFGIIDARLSSISISLF